MTPGTLRIVHHDAAFQGSRAGSAYDESVEAGAGARCAADQERYWPFHDWLFANQSGENLGAFADARLRAIATSAGLDVERVGRLPRHRDAARRRCVPRPQQGAAKGVNATPTMYLNGETIVGLHSAKELGAHDRGGRCRSSPVSVLTQRVPARRLFGVHPGVILAVLDLVGLAIATYLSIVELAG